MAEQKCCVVVMKDIGGELGCIPVCCVLSKFEVAEDYLKLKELDPSIWGVLDINIYIIFNFYVIFDV